MAPVLERGAVVRTGMVAVAINPGAEIVGPEMVRPDVMPEMVPEMGPEMGPEVRLEMVPMREAAIVVRLEVVPVPITGPGAVVSPALAVGPGRGAGEQQGGGG